MPCNETCKGKETTTQWGACSPGSGSFFDFIRRQPSSAESPSGLLADAGMARYTFPGSGTPFALAILFQKRQKIYRKLSKNVKIYQYNKNIENKSIISIKGANLDRYMNSIKQNCYRLLRLVNNIIDISKIDYGYYDIELGNYNIVSVVEDITMSVLEYVNNKGIELVFDTEVEEEIIACDPDKIERIILNLLSNAIKYTEADGKISVNIYSDKENVYITVSDTGIGIPEEKINKIFERYEQIDNKLTRNFNGSGIGLSLVRSLVEMHEGRVWVESKVNEGSKFIISLPKKTVATENVKSVDLTKSKVEKCSIEFSDIYK